MSEILDLISKQLDSDTINSLSKQLGASPEQTQQAVSAVLPTLLGAVTRNASTPAGEQQLHQALLKDHDGSLLEQLGGFFGSGNPAASSDQVSERTISGGAILDHILGNRKGRVEEGVSQASGLSASQVMKLMALVAPLLMGALGRHREQADLSADGLGEMLRGESQAVETQGGGIIGRMLDQDGDGDFDMMDVMKFGAGRLFGK